MQQEGAREIDVRKAPQPRKRLLPAQLLIIVIQAVENDLGLDRVGCPRDQPLDILPGRRRNAGNHINSFQALENPLLENKARPGWSGVGWFAQRAPYGKQIMTRGHDWAVSHMPAVNCIRMMADVDDVR